MDFPEKTASQIFFPLFLPDMGYYLGPKSSIIGEWSSLISLKTSLEHCGSRVVVRLWDLFLK